MDPSAESLQVRRQRSPSLLPWLLVPFAVAAGVLRVQSVDFFWHLAAGRWILDHGRIPRHDPFRFTSGEATPWVDHEWGFQLLLGLSERIPGGWGPGLLRAAVVAAVVALLFAALRRRGTPIAAAVMVTVAAVMGARPRFFVRPELLSLLLFLVLLLGLERFGTRPWRMGAGLALLVMLWANLHPAVLVAPVVAAAFLAAERFAPGRGRRAAPPPSGSAVVALPGTLALAVLANPFGGELYLVPWRIRQALAGLPLHNPDWASLAQRPPPYLMLFLLATMAVGVAAWRRCWRPDAGLAAVSLVLLPLVVTSVRHQGLLLISLSLLVGSALARLGVAERLGAWLDGPRGRGLGMVVAALAIGWCLWPPQSGPLRPRVRHEVGLGVAEERFPRGAVAELGRWSPVGNLYNDAPFGGYLLWRLFPPRQVFLDTRNEVRPELLRELAAARRDTLSWRALLARYEIDAAVVRYEGLRAVAPAAPGEEPLRRGSSALLFPREEFALVHWDDVAMLLLRRRAEREASLRGREYRYVDPEDWPETLRRAADPALRPGVVAELRRKLAEEPTCRRAQQLSARLP